MPRSKDQQLANTPLEHAANLLECKIQDEKLGVPREPVGDVFFANPKIVPVDQPEHMRVPKATQHGRVRVTRGLAVLVMAPMSRSPPQRPMGICGAGARTQEEGGHTRGVKRAVGEVAMHDGRLQELMHKVEAMNAAGTHTQKDICCGPLGPPQTRIKSENSDRSKDKGLQM
eukprot:CAMPEP_0196711240 /NCGR_PEP_ID=MMETSP1090-20130531/71930_1 /TAXON_ID=37098 /ORGANISM="Isochrysis sp, Strain CCMP1244" /LENGTH=171 /DNA_ID=CAMNT_0042051297 /DNA_START=513 /DNA_END=1029 /DNA_ORIENTATION=-